MKSRIICELCANAPANWTIGGEGEGAWYACDECKKNSVRRLVGDEKFTGEVILRYSNSRKI